MRYNNKTHSQSGSQCNSLSLAWDFPGMEPSGWMAL